MPGFRGVSSIYVNISAKDHLSQLISIWKRKRHKIWGELISLLLKEAKMVLCSFHRSHSEICTRNWPLSETKFLDKFSPGPFVLLLHLSGKKKAHKHKLFCPVGLGTTPGLSWGFPRDKPGENLGQTRVSSLFCTVEARQTRVCPWDTPGDEGQHRKFMWKICMCLFRSLIELENDHQNITK